MTMQDLRVPDSRPLLIRHGHGPKHEILTGIGPVPVAWVRDRGATEAKDRVRFTLTLLPEWVWRLDQRLPRDVAGAAGQ